MTDQPPKGKIVAVCSLCGWELPSWYAPEFRDHLREVHGLTFDPRPRPWLTSQNTPDS